jgi:hypothetical protein
MKRRKDTYSIIDEITNNGSTRDNFVGNTGLSSQLTQLRHSFVNTVKSFSRQSGFYWKEQGIISYVVYIMWRGRMGTPVRIAVRGCRIVVPLWSPDIFCRFCTISDHN